ncbi:MAG: TolB family protein [Ktedonobacteraceae bacterium]
MPTSRKSAGSHHGPLVLGKQDTFVYLEGKQQQQPTTYTLKRYTVSTRTTTAILSVPDTYYFGAQISADGQWVILMNPFVSRQAAIQLVRMDGQELQTLYCAPGVPGAGIGWMQWSPDNKYVAFVDTASTDQSTWTFKLLNTATGAMQTTPRDSNHLLAAPQAWLDPTHLLVIMVGLPEGGEKEELSLLDITTGISKPILSLPAGCFDATHTLDGTQLFTSLAAECHQLGSAGTNRGPSSIQVQAATGGPATTIYRTQTYAITALRVATSTSLLLLVTTDADTSHNGLWKVNTDGTGLTRLNNEAAIIKDPAYEEMGFTGKFGWNIDQPWANASRDSAYYSMAVTFHDITLSLNGLNRILIGSMDGGAPVTIASGHDATPVGWTTM